MKISILFAMLALAGCQTCEQHPVVCTAVVGVVVTSIALSANHGHHSQSNPDITSTTKTPSVNCANGACL